MRTVLNVEVVVETPDSMPSAEHDKRVGWVKENLLKSQQYVNRDVYTVTVIRDGEGNLIAFSGYGNTPSSETAGLIEELTYERRQ